MISYKSSKTRFISGLILIVIIYSLYYILYKEDEARYALSKEFKHIVKFIPTILVYLVGTYHLGKLQDKWMAKIWHLIHITGLFVITMIGFFDWFTDLVGLTLKQLANSIQELLISPALYVAMGLLNRSLNANNSEQKSSK